MINLPFPKNLSYFVYSESCLLHAILVFTSVTAPKGKTLISVTLVTLTLVLKYP